MQNQNNEVRREKVISYIRKLDHEICSIIMGMTIKELG